MKELQVAEEKMSQAVEYLRKQLMGLAERVNSKFVETLKVFYYDQQVEIGHIACVTEDGDRISIIPYDRTFDKKLEKALKQHGLNAYVFSKGQVCVSLPTQSGEDLTEVLSHIDKISESAKVSVRNTRKKTKQQFKKMKLPKEETREHEEKLQHQTDIAITEIESITKAKNNWLSS